MKKLALRTFLRFSVFHLLFASFALPARAQGTVHIVKPQESLTSIARKYGLSIAELARHNGLDRNAGVRVGQSLRIPGGTPPAAAVSPGLSPAVERAIRGANVKRGRWKYIVIHHSGTPNGSAKGMDRYHREVRHMENGLAYHFVIGNGAGMGDGEVVVGRRWTEQLDGGHVASESQNKIALGICLVGNFDANKPTLKQMKSLNALIESLLARCGLSAKMVKTHQQINVMHTRCPGSNFPARSFLKELRERNK
ncbi:MAG TPA: N-acetylmuramoyl-L-alanine amidase [Verrucomicrobiae bacterium]|nr:N-acetylmuramoyl-L-alanine amidase [Verrucomicrobiae bacterium]